MANDPFMTATFTVAPRRQALLTAAAGIAA